MFRKCANYKAKVLQNTLLRCVISQRLAISVTFLDDVLYNRSIEKLHNTKIRERFLAEEKLDLTKAISTAVRLKCTKM